MTTTKTRLYAWGNLSIRANFAQASDPIQYRVENGEWRMSSLQVADARHQVNEAFRLIREFLKSQ